MSKLNCWEYFRCGREPGGISVEKSGVCAVFECDEFNGVNHGEHAGRVCWAVSGTLCPGNIEGLKAKKISSCIRCEFFQKVEKEEPQPVFKVFPPKHKTT